MDPNSFDVPFIVNTIFVAAVGSFFGSIVGAWITHRYQRNRDDVAWEREKEKISEQYAHESEMLEKQFSQKIMELEVQIKLQADSQLRDKLIQGIDAPEKVIKELQAITNIQTIFDELKGRESREVRIKALR